MKALAECRLYAFVDTAYLRDRPPIEVARQLCDGGADLIQFRAKDWSRDAIRRTADSLANVTEAAGVGLVINDFPEIAVAAGAPLCHLGQEDFFDSGKRHCSELFVRGETVRVGVGLSTHAPEQAERAVRAGADYVAVGPVYPTGTKPTARPVTLEYVRWTRENVRIPWFAIGGISLENLDAVLEAGAERVAVVSAILKASDVAKACQKFRKRL